MDVRVGPSRRLSTKEVLLLNCGAGEDSWESLEQQGDQTSNLKGNQPWIFTGRTEAEALVLWPPDAKSWLIGKDPVAEKDWKQKKKDVAEDEMVRYHHWLNGHEFEQPPGEGGAQRSLACWGRRVGYDRVTEKQQLVDLVRMKECMTSLNESRFTPWSRGRIMHELCR